MNTHIKATKPKQWFPQHQETPPPPPTRPSSKPRPNSSAPLLSPLFLQLLRYTIA